MNKLKKFFLWFFIFSVVILLFAFKTESPSEPSSSSESALMACTYQARNRLENVIEIYHLLATVKEKSPNLWVVTVPVKGRNNFRMIVNVNVTCVLKDRGNEWELINFSQH